MQRRPIQQLSPSLVNRIAAGEVIERPASVVKELVENSIDAGATRITIDIEDGGRALIRITDDGSGIPVEDLPLAFASHATSKLSCDEDLFRIATMGFRGEALASIGAVSQARMLSRAASTEIAYEIFNRGGQIDQPQAAAGNVGTVIEIRNLFFNTPARRKFLKGSPTEFGHIGETVLRLALPHPHIAFKLLHNGRVTLDLPSGPASDRLLQAWPDEFHEARLPLDVRDAEVVLTGLIGLPELARPTPRYQFIYLNGRPIRDKFIQHALRESYRGLCEPGRHPAAILLLSIPPHDVDVNVHPTKSEVRFRDGNRIHGLVLSSVREKLLGSDLTPSAIPFHDSGNGRPDAPQELREKLADFFKSALPAAQAGSFPGPVGPSVMPVPQAWSLHPAAPVQHALPANAPPSASVTQASYSSADVGSSIPAMQLHNSYLVAESADGLIIIDQHALHERIMYEDLLARLSRGPLESQHLLLPVSVPASSRQLELLEQIQPMLKKLGIEAAPFGPDSAAVHAFPSFLERLDPGAFLRELLERGEQELLDLHQEELLHEILDMMACKAAVKAGDPLSPVEIEALLARRHLIERSSNCPHGRPTTLRLSLRDLEKQFKRTGF